MQCGKMVGLLVIADAMRRIDLSGPWACQRPLYMKDVVHIDAWWQGARSARLPPQTKYGCLRMARGIRNPAMDAVVVILFYPYCMQSCGHFRHLCARHLAAGRAKKALDLPLVQGVLWWGIIHGQ